MAKQIRILAMTSKTPKSTLLIVQLVDLTLYQNMNDRINYFNDHEILDKVQNDHATKLCEILYAYNILQIHFHFM